MILEGEDTRISPYPNDNFRPRPAGAGPTPPTDDLRDATRSLEDIICESLSECQRSNNELLKETLKKWKSNKQ